MRDIVLGVVESDNPEATLGMLLQALAKVHGPLVKSKADGFRAGYLTQNGAAGFVLSSSKPYRGFANKRFYKISARHLAVREGRADFFVMWADDLGVAFSVPCEVLRNWLEGVPATETATRDGGHWDPRLEISGDGSVLYLNKETSLNVSAYEMRLNPPVEAAHKPPPLPDMEPGQPSAFPSHWLKFANHVGGGLFSDGLKRILSAIPATTLKSNASYLSLCIGGIPFLQMTPQKSLLKVWFKITAEDAGRFPCVRDVYGVGHWGTMRWEMNVRSSEELATALELSRMAARHVEMSGLAA
jgi:predicted transport protein